MAERARVPDRAATAPTRAKVINDAIFTQATNNMVIVKDIELYSLCEHHMLPFFGRCHIGYMPRGKVFGVSQARAPGRHATRGGCRCRSG